MELTMTTTLTLSGKGEKPALRLVVDNPNFRPTMHRSDFGKRRDFEKLVKVVKNEKYLTKEERKALDLANYIEQGFHHRKLGEDSARTQLRRLQGSCWRRRRCSLCDFGENSWMSAGLKLYTGFDLELKIVKSRGSNTPTTFPLKESDNSSD
jgi:hypothetical protein